MHDAPPKPAPSSSRSLPPLRPDNLDRGRPKTRVTDPDSHARKNAPFALPPIRPGARGSRDEEHGPLPGISAIISQADADSNKHFDPRRPSEPSQRATVHFSSPARDQDGGHRVGSASQTHSTITQHRRSQESISTLGAVTRAFNFLYVDGSRQSSPEAPSALSSSFASINTTSSLSSILEDRSACSSPRPILPSFAHLDGALPPNTLPPIGSGHVSPRSSVFELSDLRTHLPMDDLTVRTRPTPRTRPALSSAKSASLPLSRSMSPAGHASSASFSGTSNNQRFNFKSTPTDREGHTPHHKKAQSQDKVPTNKKALFANETRLNKRAPSHKGDDDAHGHAHHAPKHDQPATGGGSPIISPIKVEFDPFESPASPAAKGSKDVSDFFAPKFTRTSDGSISDRPRGLHVNTSDYDQDDTMSSCTPTQTISHSSQLPAHEQSPLSAIDSSPVTATATAPHTPVIRSRSPPPEPSPLTATTSSSSTSSHSDTGLLSPRPTVTSDSEDEDTKPIIVKESEVEGEKPVGAGARYNERRAKRRGDAGAIDPASVQTRGGHFDFGLHGPPAYGYMGMGMNMGMGMGMGNGMGGVMGGGLGSGMGAGLGAGMGAGTSMGAGMGTSMGVGAGMGMGAGVGMGTGMGMGTMGMGMGHVPPMAPTPTQMPTHSMMIPLDFLEHQAHQMGYTLQPTNENRAWGRSTMPMPGRNPATHLIRQQLLRQQMLQREQAIQQLKQEQDKAAAELNNAWMHDLPAPEPSMPDQMASNFSHMMSSLQTISQDETSFIQQPTMPQEAFDLSLPSDPLPAYNNDDLLDFSAHMHTRLVPPVPVSAPLDDVLVAPLTGGPSRMPQQQQPQQQHTPAATPAAPNHVTFRTSEDTAPKDDGNTSSPGSGSGAHKCEVCGKKFRRPSGLKDHKNIHSGEKPYCCPLETCRKGFATRSNMIRHHNKTHPSRVKIGGVADIVGDLEELDVGEHESSPAASAGSGGGGGGSSSQNRFRVVQQTIGAMDAGGVGPSRGSKDRRALRKGHSTMLAA
ncbi:hypothetical protein FRC10_004262 [Ceratobasidium sp. 414]|nr:hypothetical protein FRC10_004262 [Ceratobasidium sp. 414]